MHFRGVCPDYYTIKKGGGGGCRPNLLQYYMGGGVSRDPKFVLRNKWTAPKKVTLTAMKLIEHLLPTILFFSQGNKTT